MRYLVKYFVQILQRVPRVPGRYRLQQPSQLQLLRGLSVVFRLFNRGVLLSFADTSRVSANYQIFLFYDSAFSASPNYSHACKSVPCFLSQISASARRTPSVPTTAQNLSL